MELKNVKNSKSNGETPFVHDEGLVSGSASANSRRFNTHVHSRLA